MPEMNRADDLRELLRGLDLPDVTASDFAAEARRQSRLVAGSPGEEDDQAFVDAVSGWPPDGES